MASKVVVLAGAGEDFDTLPKKEQQRIAAAMRSLKDFPEIRKGIRKLKSPFTGFRKRVGNYRILFEYENGTVFIHGIKDRKDAYR